MIGNARNLSLRVRRWIGFGALVALVALAGCSNSETAGEPRDPDPEIPATPRSTAAIGTATERIDAASPTPFLRPTSISSPTVTPVPEPVATVLERVAHDYDVRQDEITILIFTEETWASTALGCPEPGRSYAQIVTSGYEVLMMVQDELVIYHVDQSGAATVECERDDSG